MPTAFGLTPPVFAVYTMDRPLSESSGPNEVKDEVFVESEFKPERRSQSQPLFDNLMADSGTQMPKQKISEPELLIKEHAALLNLEFLKWLIPTLKPHIDLSSGFRLWLEDAGKYSAKNFRWNTFANYMKRLSSSVPRFIGHSSECWDIQEVGRALS